jgi:hypothetical protein
MRSLEQLDRGSVESSEEIFVFLHENNGIFTTYLRVEYSVPKKRDEYLLFKIKIICIQLQRGSCFCNSMNCCILEYVWTEHTDSLEELAHERLQRLGVYIGNVTIPWAILRLTTVAQRQVRVTVQSFDSFHPGKYPSVHIVTIVQH